MDKENNFNYEYDVEYSESDYIISDFEAAAQIKPQLLTKTNPQAIESIMKNIEIPKDTEYTMTKDIEKSHYMNMASDKANADYVTTTATPIAPSVQNITATPTTWKKPVIIGAACLAAIWFFNQD